MTRTKLPTDGGRPPPTRATGRKTRTREARAQDRVLIVDFGSQVTQLIARRVREAGVYSEIVPFDKAEEALGPVPPKAIILSGGPASVHETGTPQAAQALFTAGVPVLGICYGEQAMVAALGGQVEGGHSREFGRAELQIIDETPLFDGVFQEGERAPVWMSHGDRVTRLPPGFRAVGISTGAPFAAIADDSRRLYGVQFHPEVVHTPKGAALLANFVRTIAGCAGDWTMAQFRDERGRPHPRAGGRRAGDLRAVGRGRFGRRRAPHPRGDRRPAHLHLRRSRPVARRRGGERSSSCSAAITTSRWSRSMPRARFLDALQGVTDPEVKRKMIGKLFVDVFEAEADKVGRRRVPGAGHALSRRDRERVGDRRTVGHHQVASQCRRAARAHAAQADRAVARAVQGRGARARAASSGCREPSSTAIRSRARASPSASPAR